MSITLHEHSRVHVVDDARRFMNCVDGTLKVHDPQKSHLQGTYVMTLHDNCTSRTKFHVRTRI